MKKEWTRVQWKKEADSWFSKYIRWRDKGKCYTCKNKNHPKKMQCGHFVPRQYISVRYDERNNHTQCYACNMLYGGQPDIYVLNLERDYGKRIVNELNSLRSKIERYMNYESIADKYKQLHEEQLKSVDKSG